MFGRGRPTLLWSATECEYREPVREETGQAEGEEPAYHAYHAPFCHFANPISCHAAPDNAARASFREETTHSEAQRDQTHLNVLPQNRSWPTHTARTFGIAPRRENGNPAIPRDALARYPIPNCVSFS